MFQFPRFPSHTYVFSLRYWRFAPVGFPIRISPDRRLFTAPRGFSQCPTSFVGIWRLGIHHKPLVASRNAESSSFFPLLSDFFFGYFRSFLFFCRCFWPTHFYSVVKVLYVVPTTFVLAHVTISKKEHGRKFRFWSLIRYKSARRNHRAVFSRSDWSCLCFRTLRYFLSYTP